MCGNGCSKQAYLSYRTLQIQKWRHLPETIKLLEKDIGRTLFDINHSNIFLDLSPKAKKLKENYTKETQLNLKAFAQQRKPSTKLKANLLNGRQYLQMI